MGQLRLSAGGAVAWGGFAAGTLDLAAVFGFWALKGIAPSIILQSIATSVLGAEAFERGVPAALLGLGLHFGVSFVFAGAYVALSLRVPMLRTRPFVSGMAYGIVAYLVMSFVVVPLSYATFGGDWPPPLVNLAASLFIHLFLFALPIALAAGRMVVPAPTGSR